MINAFLALLAALSLLVPSSGALAQHSAQTPILSGPLAKLDIKPAEIEAQRGTPQGTLTVAQHFALDPGWLNPLEHSYAVTQQQYDYFVHDALIKAMPQGDPTYSLAEHAEVSADYKQAAFRLRPELKFQDGTPLTAADVKWTYENFKGARAKLFHDKLDHIEIVDDRTIVFHFKEPFIEFMDLYNGNVSGIGWVVPRQILRESRARRLQAASDRRRAVQAGQPGGRHPDGVRGMGRLLAPCTRDQDNHRQGHTRPRQPLGRAGDRRVGSGLRHDRQAFAARDGRQEFALGPQLHRSMVARFPRL